MTAAELTRVLGRQVTTVEHSPSPYRTSFPLEELRVELADGATLQLVRKDLRRSALGPINRRVKPEFLHEPGREIEAYRLLAGRQLGTPVYYGAGRSWILLEQVPGVELAQIGDLEDWRRAARWLGRLHATFAATPPSSRHLLDHDAAYYRLWPERAAARAPEVSWIADRYEPVIERLVALPRTLIHGEFYASNVLVAGDRVAPVDWEMAAVGAGLVDLAALVTGWKGAARAAIVASYHPRVDDVALAACRLHLALQWLGWSADWTPPPAQAYDWLGEVRETAERLGL
jgi:aminoglycoside phosphotransferase